MQKGPKSTFFLNMDALKYKMCLQGVGIVSVFFICVSILTFCLKTHPDMRVPLIHNLTVKEGKERNMVINKPVT